MSAPRAGERMVLAGPPQGTAALLRLETAERVVPVTLELPAGATLCRATVRSFGPDASEIRLRLPQGTPPGTYRGKAVVGGESREVQVVVEPVMKLRVQPKRSGLTVRPGATQEFALQVMNDGNVPLELPRVATFDLDDSDQAGALGRALRATLPPGERRVDRFFEELRESHGGEARVAVVAGAGTLEPGESRDLKCMLEVPSTVRVGHSYSGAWQVASGFHVLALDVVNGVKTNQGGAPE